VVQDIPRRAEILSHLAVVLLGAREIVCEPLRPLRSIHLPQHVVVVFLKELLHVRGTGALLGLALDGFLLNQCKGLEGFTTLSYCVNV
jgi:hypothetical protein